MVVHAGSPRTEGTAEAGLSYAKASLGYTVTSVQASLDYIVRLCWGPGGGRGGILLCKVSCHY